jgi:hypothetical protein
MRKIIVQIKLGTKLLISGCLLALFIPIISSCVADSYYSKFSVREGICKYSFEYPSHYGKPFLDTSAGDAQTTVSITVPYHEEEIINIILVISVYKKNEDQLSSANSLVEYYLRLYESGGVLDFSLIEKSQKSVIGRDGILIVYSHTNPLDAYPGKESVTDLTREVIFENDGLMWSISVTYDQKTPDSAESDFQHVLETLKIIE